MAHDHRKQIYKLKVLFNQIPYRPKFLLYVMFLESVLQDLSESHNQWILLISNSAAK